VRAGGRDGLADGRMAESEGARARVHHRLVRVAVSEWPLGAVYQMLAIYLPEASPLAQPTCLPLTFQSR
jgi:hypothetical protein